MIIPCDVSQRTPNCQKARGMPDPGGGALIELWSIDQVRRYSLEGATAARSSITL
jgi:hypothetical protein